MTFTVSAFRPVNQHVAHSRTQILRPRAVVGSGIPYQTGSKESCFLFYLVLRMIVSRLTEVMNVLLRISYLICFYTFRLGFGNDLAVFLFKKQV